jgi:hypothetical protein
MNSFAHSSKKGAYIRSFNCHRIEAISGEGEDPSSFSACSQETSWRLQKEIRRPNYRSRPVLEAPAQGCATRVTFVHVDEVTAEFGKCQTS